MSTLKPRALDLAGSVLDGRYELHAVVGEGAFGRVYRGRDRRLDRVVAVKVIKPWWEEDPDWVHTFEREAQLLARVSDPGIVQIFDVGQAPEGLYYVAEFVDGESLASRLRRGALPASEACQIARELCAALAQAHEQRVVHRDIKPANVLLSNRSPPAPRVKLGDFGVARLAEGSTDAPAGTIVGTPRYMAPEQARGLPTTPATDIYSVGVVLYEMLAGTPPFTGTSAVELALCHLHDAPPPLPASAPPALAGIVASALAKDPSERYQNGQAMASALARAAPGLPATSSGPAGPVSSHGRVSWLGGRANGETAATRVRSNGHSKTGQVAATRVAPRLSPRRNVNPAARRRSIALLGLAFAVVAAMIAGAVALAPPGQVRVPALHGLSRAAILAKTRRLSLRPAFSTRYSPAPPGTAIGQTPAPGARVDDGSVVRVSLSNGPPPIQVPRVTGQSSSPASAILSSLGLTVHVTSVPAPGVQPGVVTGQSPSAGHYVRPRAAIVLTVAETPRWRPLTSFAATGGGQSVPFTIRGTQWRVVYRMGFDGLCTLIFFCDGPTAQVIGLKDGSTIAQFGLNDGDDQTRVIHSGPGLYQVRITPGGDTASWSVAVQDYY